MSPHERLVENLADLIHQQWITWANTLMEKERLLSQDRVARWLSYMVPYSELTEEVKEFDRVWARKMVDSLRGSDPYVYDLALLREERDQLTRIVDSLQSDFIGIEDRYRSHIHQIEDANRKMKQDLEELKQAAKDLFAGRLDSQNMPRYFDELLKGGPQDAVRPGVQQPQP